MTDKNNNIEDKMVRGYGEQALRDEAQAILDQIALLDDNFEKAVDMMYHCQGKSSLRVWARADTWVPRLPLPSPLQVHRLSISTRWMYITATSV